MEQMKLQGTLEGHNGWVTQIATTTRDDRTTVISSSRDKTIIVWDVDNSTVNETGQVGRPLKSLHGHGHFVSDVVISSDGQFALSGSWDKSLRLWDLNTGASTRRFASHEKDVLSVAFSADNRQIVSGSRDRTIKLWNTLAQCKFTIQEDCHTDWVSNVRFSPNVRDPVIVSAGWDKVVKVWNLGNCRLKTNHIGHTGYINTVTVSPDGSLCASGGRDGNAMLWDLNEGKHLYTLNGSGTINALAFSPNRYWLCAAVGPVVKIWDLEDKRAIEELKPEVSGSRGSAAPQSRNEMISFSIRFAGAALLSWLTARYMIRYLDPNYESKEENKKRVAKLFHELGIEEVIELNEHELKIATQFVSSQESGADWDEIGGYEDLITELKDRVILPLKIASETRSSLLSPPKGVLLYGPPGCGKTLLAKAVAKSSGCRFINLQVSNLTDKWYGESQKLAAAVFSVAQKFQPCIIFIDEIDSFLRDRQAHDHEATAMMKAQFMQLWDGFATSTDQIIVMGATNRPGDVDAAILRRMSAKFFVSLPDLKQREGILQVILREEVVNDDADLSAIAAAAENLSGSDLKEVCRLAVLNRAKETLSAGNELDNQGPLTSNHLVTALRKYCISHKVMIGDHSLD
ncbi:unnamed protein product, partial [Mesorhabditis belari]|uniref:Small ribosomal subunit protein RACK1 n=1 Tax=Mesorhabditis belari TaxID=2138241 RepID=A0AAF3FER8_9BILA